MDEQNLPLIKRLYIYQKERFPVLLNVVAVCVFTFSAISYSRICRGADGFVSWQTYAIGCFATFTLFFLVRVFDEFKDRVDDAKYRSYLPVPRGLIKLSELRNIAIVIGILQISIIAYFQFPMLYLYCIVIGFLCLMGVEFFIPNYLKPRQILYITSHMFIIPLLDVYSSGLDWLLEGATPHFGLVFFFIVSYMNGILVEFGRKLKAPEDEEPNVVSYTKMWGTTKAIVIWIFTLLITLTIATIAAHYAGYGLITFIVLLALAIICIIPAILFMKNPSKKLAKATEAVSALWTVGMYLSLGGIPMLTNILS